MKLSHFIFLSDEGHTYQPNFTSMLLEIENLQVIGISSGIDAEHAFRNLLKENNYLKETSFENIFCYKLDNDYENSRREFCISEYV
ncbi:hypothetical protein SAMN02745883_01010 [Caminicella sporogenes DSM 14501]|uniref:Uncharacterized protein n=1 Tax=Caminicella sporogenes DSM 14501 TaxID=1121266 RepID=A0A1M6NX88_9FIRM|nr:hypothetical protein [Caminicella sporogenes]RKD21613.1 hypothetical protein BET04_07795 [Caminicella sporogenes]SHK00248.1 hypothetical protein SAMN02745883_01010 [Caminicella sporogenes DSM 14501]